MGWLGGDSVQLVGGRLDMGGKETREMMGWFDMEEEGTEGKKGLPPV